MKPMNPLMRMAVLAGVETAVRLHIRRGDNLDARDGGGITPLMLAAGRRKSRVVDLLLSAGADPSLTDPSGLDALAHAERSGSAESAALIRAALSPVSAAVTPAEPEVESVACPGPETLSLVFPEVTQGKTVVAGDTVVEAYEGGEIRPQTREATFLPEPLDTAVTDEKSEFAPQHKRSDL